MLTRTHTITHEHTVIWLPWLHIISVVTSGHCFTCRSRGTLVPVIHREKRLYNYTWLQGWPHYRAVDLPKLPIICRAGIFSSSLGKFVLHVCHMLYHTALASFQRGITNLECPRCNSRYWDLQTCLPVTSHAWLVRAFQDLTLNIPNDLQIHLHGVRWLRWPDYSI